jgi:UDP:flavonoid glycosyltransferase YjiC (YdhE family)
MTDGTHFGAVLAVAAELVRAGATVGFWTDTRFKTEVEAIGAEFFDLFDSVTVDDVDDASSPQPSRFVTFAGERGRSVTRSVREWRPQLIVRAGFAYVGEVVAKVLQLPCIVVDSGHADLGVDFRARLTSDARVRTDPRCLAAVERLHAEFGLSDASPFSYVADPSPWLTVYKEPEEWLSPQERTIYGPLAYFGSLHSAGLDHTMRSTGPSSPLRVYVSLGTIVWRYWAREVLDALHAIADGATLLGDIELVVGVGNTDLGPDILAPLKRSNVTVLPYADQWAELGKADLFITHNGLGSTHEAVARGVPMLSYPIFWDQPALAERSQQFGIALPLAKAPLAPVDPDEVAEAIVSTSLRRDQMLDRLAEARRWESRTIADRPHIAQRILGLA